MVVNSSRPSWPKTTMAWTEPNVSSTCEHLDRHHRVGDTDELARRPGRIDQGSDEVEDRRDAQLSAHRGGVAHRRVEPRREAESDARLFDAPAYPIRAEIDHDAERLQDVGGAGERGSRPPAVLANNRPCSCHDKCAQGGDVDRPAAVPARATGVDDLDADVEVLGVGTHGAHETGHLLDGLALGTKPGDQSAYLGRRRRSLEDLVQGCGRLIAREVLPAQDLSQYRRPSTYGVERRCHRQPQSHQRWWSSTPRAIRFS